MGLLDNLNSGQSADFGGQGGLLELIARSLAMNNQKPSEGFPSTQPVQAQPVAVGKNYQMPRMGNADQYVTSQVMTPDNAQPAQGQMPAQAQQAPQQAAQHQEQLPPALGGAQPVSVLDRLTRGLQSVGNGGGIISAMTGNYNDPVSLQQQNMRSQYDAYKGSGLTPAMAQLAVFNPKAAEKFIESMAAPTYSAHNVGTTAGSFNRNTGEYKPSYSEPKFDVLHKDEFGNETRGFISPRDKTTTPYVSQPSQPAVPSTIQAVPAGQNPKIWRDKQTERAVTDAMPASFDDTAKMRTEISKLPSYQNISQAAPIYKSMHDAAGRNTKAADLNMVYGLGKIMDPGSVVREGEIHMANNAQGWQEKLNGVVAQINGQGGLTPAGREALMAEAHSRMQSYKQMYDQDAERFRGIAARNKADPRDVVHDFGEFQPWAAQKSPAGAPQIDDLLKKYGPK